MTPQSSLKLEKWYFDVVGPDGDLFVGYHIQLSPPGLNIAAGLWRLAGRLSNFMPRITRQNPPIAEAGFMQARCRGGSGSWRSITPQVAVTLLDTEQVRVEWECLACGARAEFSDPDHGQVVGFGYAEKLVITGKPWLVPIHTLYWGRMVAEHFSLVWIKWVGPVPIERAWLNGQCCDDVMISNHQVSTKEGVLRIPDGIPLRTARLSETLKSLRAPLLRRIAKRLGFIDERKWLSEATWTGAEGVQVSGWCIHEIATWQD